MISNASVIAVIYSLVSLIVFFAFKMVSKKISGDNFTSVKYWMFFVVAILLWGGAHMTVSNYEYIMFFPSTKEFLANNSLIRWIAFIGALLQTTCMPYKYKPKRRFFRE